MPRHPCPEPKMRVGTRLKNPDPVLALSIKSMETHVEEVIDREARLNWGAAVVAGVAAGAVVWLLSHGTPWFTSGLVSAELMGRDPGQVGLRPLAVIGAHFLLSACYG